MDQSKSRPSGYYYHRGSIYRAISLFTTLSLRWCDRRDMIPSVSIREFYLYEISPEEYPELAHRLVQSFDLLKHFEKKFNVSSPL